MTMKNTIHTMKIVIFHLTNESVSCCKPHIEHTGRENFK